jgi:AraC-like DNA-binding protein
MLFNCLAMEKTRIRYIQTPMKSDLFSIRRCVLPGVHAVEARSSRAFPRHRHDRFGVGLMTRGAHRSWSGRGNVEAERGDLITCNPEEVHDGLPISASREWKMLYLAPRIVSEIVADIRGEGSGHFEFRDPVMRHRSHNSAFDVAYQVLTNDQCAADCAHEKLILLFAGLFCERSTLSTLLPSPVTQAKALIDDNPLAQITLRQLAAEAQMSRFQLLRSFMKLTGFTPHAYILQRRLEIARGMLGGELSLATIAADSGFADQSHFTRVFTARHGVTPNAYARATR